MKVQNSVVNGATQIWVEPRKSWFMSFVIQSIFDKVYYLALKEGLPEKTIEHFRDSIVPNGDTHYAPTDLFYQMYEIIEKELDPAFSVRVGQLMELDDYGVLGLTWKTCASPRDMFVRCERYFRLMTDTTLFSIKDYGDMGTIYIDRPAARRGIEISNESSTVATATVINKLLKEPIWPVSVSFAHDKPGDIAPYEEYFRCEVSFNQPRNSLTYTSADLDTRSIKADKSINRFLMNRLDEQSKDFKVQADQLLVETKELIKDSLPSGIPSADFIGKSLGMSTRTLSRRLSEKGLTFRELVQEIQRELSIHLITNSMNSIGEIAYQTGFSEQSAFNRAFKRWTGKSPLSYRK